MKKKIQEKPTELERVLRKAVKDSGLTRYAVAKGAGIDVAVLLRFVAGTRTLTLPTAGKLAAFLELGLKPVQKK